MDLFGFFKLCFDLFKSYGTFGIAVGQIILILYLFKKLFTNHLHHVNESIKNVHAEVSGVKADVEHVRKEVAEDRKATQKIGLRVAHIEGQLLERRWSRNVNSKAKVNKAKSKRQ